MSSALKSTYVYQKEKQIMTAKAIQLTVSTITCETPSRRTYPSASATSLRTLSARAIPPGSFPET